MFINIGASRVSASEMYEFLVFRYVADVSYRFDFIAERYPSSAVILVVPLSRRSSPFHAVRSVRFILQKFNKGSGKVDYIPENRAELRFHECLEYKLCLLSSQL